MQDNSDNNQNRDPLISSRSIRRLLERRWFVVVLALSLTGLGATITGLLFQSGIHLLSDWRRDLLHDVPAWIVLPFLGAFGGLVSGWLISNLAPAAGGAGVTHIMGFLHHKSVPMGLRVGLVKLVAGIIAIGCGFPLGPEGPAVQMGGSVAWQMSRWLKAPIAFRRVIVAAGGGAGIAAVFSAPLGGFIYAIEELLHSARPVVLLLVLITTFSADTWADVLGVFGLGSGAPGFYRRRRVVAVLARVESAFEESARRFGEESVAREMWRVNLRGPASSRCLSRDAAGIRVRFPVSTRASVDRTRLARVRCARGVVYASARLAAASRVQHLSPRDARAWIFFGAESTRVSHFPRCTKVND